MDLKLLKIDKLNTTIKEEGDSKSKSPATATLKHQVEVNSPHQSQFKKPIIRISTQTNHGSVKSGYKFSTFNSPMLRGMNMENRSMGSPVDDQQVIGLSKFGPGQAIQEGEGWQVYTKVKQDLDDTIKDLDLKLNRVLAKQEFDYLKGYNIYVKRKEKELRDLIKKLSDKNQNVSLKDEKMMNMESTISNIRDEQQKMEKQCQEMRDKIKFWKNKAENLESEKNFLYGQAFEAKRKNKLLKVAIGRLQQEIEKFNQQSDIKAKIDGEIQKSQFFITDLLQAVEPSKRNSPRQPNNSTTTNNPFDLTNDISTMQHSLLEASTLLASARANNSQKIPLQSKRSHYHHSTSVSRYASIPTENIKFSKFIDLLFKSKMSQDEVQQEIKKYVQALETNYAQIIQELKDRNERMVRKLKMQKSERVNQVCEKNEMEAVFVECIEEVRKEVMKRRLKSEIQSRKKFISHSAIIDSGKNTGNGPIDDDAKEFEESLMKLAQLAKNRVKYSDFTSKDRFNVLDLFVNNEKTLIKVYEALFPNKQQLNYATTGQVKPLQEPMNKFNIGGLQNSNAIGSVGQGTTSKVTTKSSTRVKNHINHNEFLLEIIQPSKEGFQDLNAAQDGLLKKPLNDESGIQLQQTTKFPSLARHSLNQSGFNTAKAASVSFRNSFHKQ